MHYIQKVALSWADEHITTVDQARNSSAFYNKTCYSILNAFGIKGRGPASAELDYIRKWLEDGNFELDLILEACNRTISAIHQPSFEYTDKILENWKTGNVRTLADVERLDSAFEQEKTGGKLLRGKTVHLLPSSLPNSVILKNVLTIWTSLPKNYYAVTKKGEHCAVN